MKIWFKFIGFFLFITLFFFLKININDILYAVAQTDLVIFSISVFMLLPLYTLKAQKWRYIIKKMGGSYPIKRAIEVYWIGIFTG
ncbi:MAG: flippase-like domain-containing protein, partial [Planctomycetes bacterium]|nr:flippase-like domain-containing protein [Planctomycetota bacterium]